VNSKRIAPVLPALDQRTDHGGHGDPNADFDGVSVPDCLLHVPVHGNIHTTARTRRQHGVWHVRITGSDQRRARARRRTVVVGGKWTAAGGTSGKISGAALFGNTAVADNKSVQVFGGGAGSGLNPPGTNNVIVKYTSGLATTPALFADFAALLSGTPSGTHSPAEMACGPFRLVAALSPACSAARAQS
jgi:hypothetical protein